MIEQELRPAAVEVPGFFRATSQPEEKRDIESYLLSSLAISQSFMI
ncbi:MAG: hypothetical protein GX301_01300 [Gracilibacteraceae bacterium]|jgi:hypothetical protein|nr:hypothetical protein [Gracilibacteraceae bacterium]